MKLNVICRCKIKICKFCSRQRVPTATKKNVVVIKKMKQNGDIRIVPNISNCKIHFKIDKTLNKHNNKNFKT